MGDRQFSIPNVGGGTGRIMIESFGGDVLEIDVLGKKIPFEFTVLCINRHKADLPDSPENYHVPRVSSQRGG
jgi:hypothetical protein